MSEASRPSAVSRSVPPSGRPVIGIPCDVRREERPLHFVFEAYVRCVENAGGLPLLVPPLSDPEAIPQILERVHGVLFVGGEDIDPRRYGEEPLPTHDPVPEGRGAFDLAFARAVLENRVPVLGVCYGSQLLAVADGGALWQDLPSQVPGVGEHAGTYPDLPVHPVEVAEGSRLHTLLGARRVPVNSAHHQAVKRLGEGWIAAAHADDGVIEAIERTAAGHFALGVEWHPELIAERPEQQRLFEALVEAARAGAPGGRAATPRR